MISFVHPLFAWLFLLLFLFIGVYRSKPSFRSIRVPSISLWPSEQLRKTKLRKGGKVFRPELSSLLFLSAITLLIFSLMTPAPSAPPTAINSEEKLIVLYTQSIPEPVLRVLRHLDNVVIFEPGNEQKIPETASLVSVSSSLPPIDPETGNVLHVNLDDEANPVSDSVLFQVLTSEPNREIAQLRYTTLQTKKAEFPLAVAKAINHFSFNGVNSGKRPLPQKETISRWLTAAAGILILLRMVLPKWGIHS